MKKLDKSTALRLLAKVVKDRGEDYRMPSFCYYFEDDKPICIVGAVFHEFGNAEAIELLRLYNGTGLLATTFDALPITPNARAVLVAAQDVQDDFEIVNGRRVHHTWGDALKTARLV